MDVVISLGGSLIVPQEIDVSFLKSFVHLVHAHTKKGYHVVIICGGGYTCRWYQHAAKKLGCTHSSDLDWIGIRATHLNAELIRSLFKEAYDHVITNPTEKIKTDKKIIIGCGWKPGFSSDMDSVQIANNLCITHIINLTNVDYVYDKDPRKYPDAQPKKTLTWKELQHIVGNKWTPGANFPFDPKATAYAAKTKKRLYIVKGNITNLKNILEGKKVTG